MLKNDVLISEVNVESLQVRSSGTTELYKVLQEPKFRTVDSDDLLSERLLLVKFCSTFSVPFIQVKNIYMTEEIIKHGFS